jgi:hypothetical protein
MLAFLLLLIYLLALGGGPTFLSFFLRYDIFTHFYKDDISVDDKVGLNKKHLRSKQEIITSSGLTPTEWRPAGSA